MSFPIYRHDLPWDDWRDTRARRGSKKHVESLSNDRPSIWKRELSLGRKKDEPADVVAQAAEPVETPPAEETPSERTSIWKRELSFGRKKHRDDDEAGEQPEDEVVAPEPVAEVEPDEFAPVQLPEPVAGQPAEGWRVSGWQPVQAPTPEPASVEPEATLEFEPAPMLEVEPEPAHEPTSYEAEPRPEPEVEETPAPAAERTSIWKRDLSFGRKSKDTTAFETVEAQTVESQPVAIEAEAPFEEQSADGWHVSRWQPVEAPAPEPAPEPDPVAAAPTYDFSAPVEPEPTLEFEPAPMFEVEPEPAHEPTSPAAERTSIWKRDLSFGRKSKDATEPETVEPDVAEPVAEEAPEPAKERTSIWKRELGGKKKEKKSKKKGSDWEFGTDADTTASSETVEAQTVEVEPVAAVAADGEPVDDQPDAGKKRRRKEKKEKQPRVKGSKGARGAKKVVGLRIGASQIAAAHVQSNGHHELLKMARMPLDRGVVVAGELRDPEALADALRVFFKQHKLPKQGIRLGIASNRVGVRVLEVSGVEDLSLLGNAVQFRAQEVLPIPLSEAVLDYRVLRERTEEDGTVTREVLVAFAYRELVDRYTSVCRTAGLRLIGIDLDGFALLRALVDPADPGERLNGAAVVTVALGHDRSIMSVTDGTLCEFTRVIEWGGASLDTAVARILALTPSQAEPIKRELTLDRYAETPDGLSDDQATRARAAMVQEVHTFAREFVSSLQFYQAQPGSLDIGEIVVTGGTAHMPGLVEQLQELIGVAVRIGDPLGRVKVSKGVHTDEPVGSLALAIGLGIED